MGVIKNVPPIIFKKNHMYNKTIEKLIELALVDGELSEKEKHVLFKKAEEAEIDLDEFEMVLEARLFEKLQSLKHQDVSFHNSDKYGVVKKCPSCGSIVMPFSINCSDCGHYFSDIEANVSIEKLFKLLTDVDSQPRKEFGHFDNDKKIEQIKRILEQKTELIKNFPIPNTKNDILEFLTFAVPHAKKVKTGFSSIFTINAFSNAHRDQQLAKAWKYKCEQIIMKAKFSLNEDKNELEKINVYAQELGIN
jgi:hypothetical protein